MTYRMTARRTVLLVGLACVCFPMHGWASTFDSRVGLRAGANLSHLAAPEDAEGEPTLQSGASFDGLGFGGGIAASSRLFDLSEALRLDLELDILFTSHRVSSRAESPATEQVREVELTALMLQAPLIPTLAWQISDGLTTRLGVGPVLLFGLSSGASVAQENIPGDVQPLFTTPVTHVGLVVGAGLDIGVSERFSVPIDLRFVLDPAVPSTTLGRFDNYQDENTPGTYQVGFDYQFVAMIGVDYLFSLAGD